MTGATRFTYTPQDGILAAGTLTQFKAKVDPDFTPLTGMLAIGQVGEKSPVIDQTTLEDTAKRSMAGQFDGPEKDLKGKFYPDDVGQQAFIAAAQATEIVTIQHIWPDDTVATYEVALLGYLREDTKGEAAIDWVVPCKQNGKTQWSKVGAP